MDAVILDGLRTPFGKHRGALSNVRPDDMAGHVIRALLARHEDARAAVEEVIFGCANQAGEDNRNVARMGLLLAGLPFEVTGVTVNRLCASGLEAVVQAARAIKTGDANVMIAGGVESMTRAPYSLEKASEPFPRTPPAIFDTVAIDLVPGKSASTAAAAGVLATFYACMHGVLSTFPLLSFGWDWYATAAWSPSYASGHMYEFWGQVRRVSLYVDSVPL